MSLLKVRVLGLEDRDVEFREGLTVSQLLEEVGVTETEKQTVTVNGDEAGVGDEVPDEAVVVVTPNVKNG